MRQEIGVSFCKNLNFHVSVHQNLLDNPPIDINYSFVKGRLSSNDFPLNPINLGYFFLPKLPVYSARTQPTQLLIHTNGVHTLNNSPWIADFEDLSYWYGASRIVSQWKLNLSKRFFASINCKKLIAMSEFAKNSLIDKISDKKILNKIEIIYPTIKIPIFKKINSKIPTIIYAARGFHRKGGLDVLKAFDVLNKKLDLNLFFIGDIPNNIKQKFQNPNIQFFDVLSKNELFKKFALADVFILPTLADTIPTTIFEAFAFKLPVITTNSKHNPAAKELIVNEKTGLLVSQKENINPLPEMAKENNLQELIEKTQSLLENSSFRKQIARNAFKEMVSGRFAYSKRIQKLRNIYEEAIS